MLTRHVQEAGQAGARPHEDLHETGFTQLLDGGGLADHEAGDEASAQGLDLGHHIVDELVGQPELRNAVAQHAAELVEGLEDSDREALGRHQVGGDQTGRTRTHHRHRRTGALLPGVGASFEAGLEVLGLGALLPLRQEPLQLADAHGVLVHAVGLALQLLGAHPAGHVRQRVDRLQVLQGFAETSGAHQFEHLGDVHAHRAAAVGFGGVLGEHTQHTRGLGALHIAQRLQPHDQFDFAQAVAQIHVAQVALIDELEVSIAILGLANVGADAVQGGPLFAGTGEHRVTLGQLGIDSLHEAALAGHGQIPQHLLQRLAGRITAQQGRPQCFGELPWVFRQTEVLNDCGLLVFAERGAVGCWAEQPLDHDRGAHRRSIGGHVVSSHGCDGRTSAATAGGLGPSC